MGDDGEKRQHLVYITAGAWDDSVAPVPGGRHESGASKQALSAHPFPVGAWSNDEREPIGIDIVDVSAQSAQQVRLADGAFFHDYPNADEGVRPTESDRTVEAGAGADDMRSVRLHFSQATPELGVVETCRMCGRPLDAEADPLSGDCGGDCWGCVGWVEARMFGVDDNPSVDMVRKEIDWGWREADGTPKSPESIRNRAGETTL